MTHHTVYVCNGGCQGVSEVQKNCGAPDCPSVGKALEARVQCDACAAAAEHDGGNHACPACKAA